MPYGANVVNEVSKTLYHGTIRYMHIIEPYMPDRVLRQFGYLQIIPSAPIVPLRGTKRSRLMNTYRVNHSAMDSQWNVPRCGLDSAYYGHQAQPPHQAVSDYLEWFIERSHPRVHPIDDNARDEAVLEPSAYPAIVDITRTLVPYYPQHLPEADVSAGFTTIPIQVLRELYDLTRVFADHFHLDDDVATSDRRS